MNIIIKFFAAIITLACSLIPLLTGPASSYAYDDAAILVGKIACVEGQVLRYVPEEKDWVTTVEETPFGVEDILYSSYDGKAEIILPNNTWIRIDGDTQIELNALTNDLTEIYLDSATARLYNKSSGTVIKAVTAFGSLEAAGGAIVDLYVADGATEVIALKGTAIFSHSIDNTRHEVIAGSSSIIADKDSVTAGGAYGAYVASAWDGWNRERDRLWAERMRESRESSVNLPPSLRDEAYVLDTYGRWEDVYYDDAYYRLWRPVRVDIGWAPFTMGRWTLWCGDHTWIPYEPFGYVTHHYGNWICTNGLWYWAPPVNRVSLRTGHHFLNIGYGWYPGRVVWINSGVHVGWVPLAPFEPYYCHRRWGRHSVVINDVAMRHFDNHPERYRNHRRAIIIDRDNLYRLRSYETVRVKNVRSATLTKTYRATPVLQNAHLTNQSWNGKQFFFTTDPPRRKPDRAVTERITHGRTAQPHTALVNTGNYPKSGTDAALIKPAAKGRKHGNRQDLETIKFSAVKTSNTDGRMRVESRDLINSTTTNRKEPPAPKVSNRATIVPGYRGQIGSKTEMTKKSVPPVAERRKIENVYKTQTATQTYRRSGEKPPPQDGKASSVFQTYQPRGNMGGSPSLRNEQTRNHQPEQKSPFATSRTMKTDKYRKTNIGASGRVGTGFKSGVGFITEGGNGNRLGRR